MISRLEWLVDISPASTVATSMFVAMAVLHHVVIHGHCDYGVPWKCCIAGHHGSVSRCACTPESDLRVLAGVRVIRMTAIGLEYALEWDVVVRPSECRVAGGLYVVAVLFMSLIGMRQSQCLILKKCFPLTHRLMALFGRLDPVCWKLSSQYRTLLLWMIKGCPHCLR